MCKDGFACDSKDYMKKGDLITVDVPGPSENVLGILLESIRESEWGDRRYCFWKVLTQEGKIIGEFESYMTLVRNFDSK